MKLMAKSGFAGILLDAASVLVWRGNTVEKASPTRIGSPLPGGIPTADVTWIPSYSFEIRAIAFEDYGGDDDFGWRRYPKDIKEEGQASQWAPFALEHLKSGYPDVVPILSRLEEDEAKRRDLLKATPAGLALVGPYRPGGFDVDDLAMAYRSPSLLKPRTVKNVDPALMQELGKKFTEVERDRATLIKALAERLSAIRLRVVGGMPLEGGCEICTS